MKRTISEESMSPTETTEYYYPTAIMDQLQFLNTDYEQDTEFYRCIPTTGNNSVFVRRRGRKWYCLIRNKIHPIYLGNFTNQLDVGRAQMGRLATRRCFKNLMFMRYFLRRKFRGSKDVVQYIVNIMILCEQKTGWV